MYHIMRAEIIMFAFAVTLFLFFGVAVEGQTCSDDTISVTPMPNFDLRNKIRYKWWYVQESFWRSPEEVTEPPGDCYTQQLNEFGGPGTGGDLLLNEDWTDPNTGEFVHKTTWVFTLSPSSIWGLSSSPFRHEYRTTYTHTDYNTYAVMHFCSADDRHAPIPFEHVLVLTGVSNPNATLLEGVRGMVASLGFPTDHSVKVKHSHDTNCTYCTDCSPIPIYDTEKDGKTGKVGVVFDFEE